MNEYRELEEQSSVAMLGGVIYIAILALMFNICIVLVIIHAISFPVFYWSAMDKLLTFDFDKHWHSKGNFNRLLFNAVPIYAIVRKYYIEKKEKK